MPPSSLAHVVIRSGSIPRMRDWYCAVLEATVAFENDDGCFLRYDDEHHRVAIARDDRLANGSQEPRRRLDHVAFGYPSIHALLRTQERLRDVGISPYWTVNHGPTTSFYYRDPDGNSVELQVDNSTSTAALHAFFQSPAFDRNPIGVDVDPDDLRRRLADGEPESSILRRPDLT